MNRLTVLALIASHHVNRLLNDVEVEILPVILGIKVEVGIDKTLLAGVKKCVNVTLIPPSLLNGLKFAIEVV